MHASLVACGLVSSVALALAAAARNPRAGVRWGLILPLQSVLPLVAAFTLARNMAAFRSSPLPPSGLKSAASSRPTAAFVWWFAKRSGRQLLRAWFTAEIWFYIYYHIRRRALQNSPTPLMPPVRTVYEEIDKKKSESCVVCCVLCVVCRGSWVVCCVRLYRMR